MKRAQIILGIVVAIVAATIMTSCSQQTCPTYAVQGVKIKSKTEIGVKDVLFVTGGVALGYVGAKHFVSPQKKQQFQNYVRR